MDEQTALEKLAKMESMFVSLSSRVVGSAGGISSAPL